MAIPLQPQTNPLAPTPPSRENLIRMLASANEEGSEGFTDIVNAKIKQFSLPYFVEGGQLKDTLTPGEVFLRSFITVDKDTIEMKNQARLMAKSQYPVLVFGETGTGKEIIASSMIADRKGEPIKSFNCAGFAKELVESELFGSVKGSFTGSTETREGLFMSAKKGVMFLDEVSELPLSTQGTLLRAIQSNSIRRVGATKDELIECKFVCASNRDIKKMVEEGTFRKDLYARISTLELDIKPIRDRRDDIVPICESINGGKKFLEQYKEDILGGALSLEYNVRSLQQHITRFLVLGKVIY